MPVCALAKAINAHSFGGDNSVNAGRIKWIDIYLTPRYGYTKGPSSTSR